jgi:hypothetical protein
MTMLTLSTHPSPSMPPRSLVPPCLQPRAPHSYELYDEAGNRMQPTLSGFKLQPGHSYRLKVRAQDGKTSDWKLRLLAPRSQITAHEQDLQEGDQRVIQFDVVSRPLWEQFKSRISVLPIHLEHADGRELYRFEIPVVVTMHWAMWLVSLIGIVCAPMSFLFNESELWTKLLLLGGLIGAVFVVLSAVDFYRSYQRGQQVVRQTGTERSKYVDS